MPCPAYVVNNADFKKMWKTTLNSEQEPKVKGVTMISSTWIQSWTPKEIQSLQANDSVETNCPVVVNLTSHLMLAPHTCVDAAQQESIQ